MELLYKFCYGLTTILGILQGMFVLYKNPRSRVNRLWAIMSFTVATWAFVVQGFFEPNYQQALFKLRFFNAAAVFIPVFFTHFCLALLNKPLRESWLAVGGYTLAIVIGSLCWTPWYIPTVSPKLVFPNYVEPGPLYVIFTVHFFILVIYSHWLLFKHLHRQPPERQNQIKYVATGTIIGYFCGSTTFLLVYDIPFNPLPSLFTPVYFAFITYAIVKHHLMDITIVIRKSLVYSVLVTALTVGYFGLVYAVEWLFRTALGYHSVWLSLTAFALMALFFQPLKIGVQRIVDWLFFRAPHEEIVRRMERLEQEIRKSDQMKAVATLAAGLAHEIKNPLTAIKTFTEFLPEKYDDPSFREKFTRIVGQEVDKIHRTVQDLLAFAKPESEKREPVALGEVVQDTLTLLSNDCLKRHITTEVQVDPSLRITGDRTKLKQALLNLCLNSLDAMESGGALHVSTHAVNGHAVLSVADTGCGIPKDQLKKVFDPFFTTKFTGTGLGLSVVQGIVNEHGGMIRITSRPGLGTTVKMELPL